MTDILIHGIHGLGDNLHQRAIVRQCMQRGDVWLESSWVAPYHDLVSAGLRIIRKPTSLRTQKKNADRERSQFSPLLPPRDCEHVSIRYSADGVRMHGSVLGAMCAEAGADIEPADFRMPVPDAWRDRARAVVGLVSKPILVYRPLVERTEWGGCAARNPDEVAYAALFDSIRDQFHVVSVADLVQGVEWISGLAVDHDQAFHAGELDFEALAGLFSISSMVFAAPGFAVILAQAVGTPVVATFGSFECSKSFSAGARFTPYLGIDPIHPSDDFQHDASRDKAIDLPAAKHRLGAFACEAAKRHDRRS